MFKNYLSKKNVEKKLIQNFENKNPKNPIKYEKIKTIFSEKIFEIFIFNATILILIDLRENWHYFTKPCQHLFMLILSGNYEFFENCTPEVVNLFITPSMTFPKYFLSYFTAEK